MLTENANVNAAEAEEDAEKRGAAVPLLRAQQPLSFFFWPMSIVATFAHLSYC